MSTDNPANIKGPQPSHSTSLFELIRENNINVSENPLLDEIGKFLWNKTLLIREADPDFLRGIQSMQARRSVWNARWGAKKTGTHKVITYWRAIFATTTELGLSDVVIIDTGNNAPRCIDGHHRIVAAIAENKTLRYVDLADLSD